MKKYTNPNILYIFIFLFFGIYQILRSLTPTLSQLPGDLGDTRFNLYILEHFFQWLAHPTTNYWDASFYFPFPFNIAFSDSLLGSAPIYALFRLFGISRESAFQGWYIFGCILNYASAVFVLRKMDLSPLAAAFGAFFFAFGLPVLAQENHVQLLYRFGIPLATYYLWQFSQKPRLSYFLGSVFYSVWQFYLAIYSGYFLGLLLFCMMLIIPWLQDNPSLLGAIRLWPNALKEAWMSSTLKAKFIYFGALLLSLGSLIGLLYPYYKASNLYHFTRSVNEIKSMLPTWQSYFLADRSVIWAPISAIIRETPMRHEHQLFPGVAVLILILIGLFWRFKGKHRSFALLNLLALAALVLFTLNFHGLSIYGLFLKLPGLNSIRAVTRIQLVLMWPIAVFGSTVLDALFNHKKWLLKFVSILMVFVLFLEVSTFTHITFSKRDSQLRVIELREEIKSTQLIMDQNLILLIGSDMSQPWFVSELDAMLVAQELSIPTLNGYSGNLLHGSELVTDCNEASNRINRFIHFMDITDEHFGLDLINRVQPIRLGDCNFQVDKFQ